MYTKFKIDCATADYRLDRYSFDSHIAGALDPLREEWKMSHHIPEVGEFVVDASKVREADNYGCLGLVLLCAQLLNTFEASVILYIPGDGSFYDDFFNGGFFHYASQYSMVLGPSKTAEPKFTSRRTFVTNIIAAKEDISALCAKFIKNFKIFLNNISHKLIYVPKESHIEFIGNFVSIGLELSQNILEHSQTKEDHSPFGYVSYLLTPEYIDIAVMDLGIGIPVSLGYESTEAESVRAIQAACRENISAKKEDGRGLGLYMTKQQVMKMEGEMAIRSGKANVIFNSSNKYYGHGEHAKGTPFFKGTQIHLRLPLISILEDKDGRIEVYDF